MLKVIVVASIFAVVGAQNRAMVYLFDPFGVQPITGNITFTKTDNGIVITGVVAGLAPGIHGFHIHQLGHIGPGCLGTGGHFNPYQKTHGDPNDTERHVGDLGNIMANDIGVAHFEFTDNIISLDGKTSIIGRAVVVHENEDDFGKGGHQDSLTTGHAGGRVACGVIGILEHTK